jgi:hypothetical protein
MIAALRQVVESHPLMPHQKIKPQEVASSDGGTLIIKRKIGNAPAESRSEYQPGDLVLYDTLCDDKARRSAKLDSRYKGPYELLRHVKDEVECRHLALGSFKQLLVERLKIIVDRKDDAFKLAMEDADQFFVNRITAWKGRNKKKEKRNLTKKRKRHINNNTFVKHWFPPSFYCLVLQCDLVLFPEMSASQSFCKGSGDFLEGYPCCAY